MSESNSISLLAAAGRVSLHVIDLPNVSFHAFVGDHPLTLVWRFDAKTEEQRREDAFRLMRDGKTPDRVVYTDLPDTLPGVPGAQFQCSRDADHAEYSVRLPMDDLAAAEAAMDTINAKVRAFFQP